MSQAVRAKAASDKSLREEQQMQDQLALSIARGNAMRARLAQVHLNFPVMYTPTQAAMNLFSHAAMLVCMQLAYDMCAPSSPCAV